MAVMQTPPTEVTYVLSVALGSVELALKLPDWTIWCDVGTRVAARSAAANFKISE
ncbi:hypothetical protein PAMP_014646 [Pampus punctatissimus]